MKSRHVLLAIISGLVFALTGCGGGGGTSAPGSVNQSPSINSQPASLTVASGNNASFTVNASGTGLSYQWQVDTGAGFVNISNSAVYSGATTAAITLTSVTLGMNGYKYRVIINGAVEPPATSNSVTLTVQPTKAIIILATSGTLPATTTIGALDTTINYSTNKGLSIASSDVVASGVATGAFVAPNTNNVGQVRLANLTLSGTGFPIGEFATLTFSIVAGNYPVTSDFTVAPGTTSIYDSNVNLLSNISVIISSVTLQ